MVLPDQARGASGMVPQWGGFDQMVLVATAAPDQCGDGSALANQRLRSGISHQHPGGATGDFFL